MKLLPLSACGASGMGSEGDGSALVSQTALSSGPNLIIPSLVTHQFRVYSVDETAGELRPGTAVEVVYRDVIMIS